MAPSTVEVDITQDGVVFASSVYGGKQYPEWLSVDGDLTTSWFSGGPDVDGSQATFTWTGQQEEVFTEIVIWSNADHAVPEFRTGFGFEAVTLLIYDAEEVLVYEASTGLGGTPDPDVAFLPQVQGQQIVLIFTGHEAPDCGGFAELQVFAAREAS